MLKLTAKKQKRTSSRSSILPIKIQHIMSESCTVFSLKIITCSWDTPSSGFGPLECSHWFSELLDFLEMLLASYVSPASTKPCDDELIICLEKWWTVFFSQNMSFYLPTEKKKGRQNGESKSDRKMRCWRWRQDEKNKDCIFHRHSFSWAISTCQGISHQVMFFSGPQ